ncbi:MAG TPA: hypothetical protein VNY73_01560 [Bacteroidia bacterium]|jgi:hypothetical protein|nr:hypothetical protein [Bacteroidia bacterium]
MKKTFTLLLVTDYSENAMNTERHTFQLAKVIGSMVRILHVFVPPLAMQVGSFEAEKIFGPLRA